MRRSRPANNSSQVGSIRIIRCKVDKRSYPANPTLLSWRDPVLLKEIAENHCRTMIVPNLVAAWAAARKTPGKPAERVEPSPGTQGPAASHTAPAAPPGNGIAPFTDAVAEPGPPAAVQVPAAPESDDEKDAVSITDPIGAPARRNRCSRRTASASA